MRSGIGPIIGRIAAIITGLLVIGIVIKLALAALLPVMPEWFGGAVAAGWVMLMDQFIPVIAPLMALLILGTVIWLITGRR